MPTKEKAVPKLTVIEQQLQETSVAEEALAGEILRRHHAKIKKGFVKIPKLAMKNMAMEMVMTGMSLSDCEQAYAIAIRSLPGGKAVASLPNCKFFERSRKRARIVGLVMNALELMHALEWIGVSGDGTTDHNLFLGPQEYYAHVFEITSGFTGKPKAIFIDGYLRSQGLTANDERKTCLYAVALMKLLAQEAIKLFAKQFPDKVSTDKHLGEGALGRVDNIGYKWIKQFKADGAAVAQLWAHLMVKEKLKELKEHISDEEMAKLPPKEQHMLTWAFVHNCTMHNLNLGAVHGEKAARAITKLLTASMVENMKTR